MSNTFLEPFVIDPAVLYLDPGTGVSDFVKSIHDVFTLLREDPMALTLSHITATAQYSDCQVKDNQAALHHAKQVANISKELATALHECVPEVDLLQPELIHALGLVHDYSAFYATYNGLYTQEDKELTLYFQARALEVPLVEKHSAMHAAYFEILDMIQKGEGFAKIPLYQSWTQMLNDSAHPYNFEGIKKDFDGFLTGTDNLSLMVVTLADCLDNERGTFDKRTMHEDFQKRTGNIVDRYYFQQVYAGQHPKALGVALIQHNGLERLIQSRDIIYSLLSHEEHHKQHFKP